MLSSQRRYLRGCYLFRYTTGASAVATSVICRTTRCTHLLCRINGQQSIVCTLSFYPCNLSLEVCFNGQTTSLDLTNNDLPEPNNASPLNSEAAALWDTPEGKMLTFSMPVPTVNSQPQHSNPSYWSTTACPVIHLHIFDLFVLERMSYGSRVCLGHSACAIPSAR